MKVNRGARSERFEGEDGGSLVVEYDNRGDPYVEGVTLRLSDENYVSVFLDKGELKRLRDLAIRLCPLRRQ